MKEKTESWRVLKLAEVPESDDDDDDTCVYTWEWGQGVNPYAL